MSIKDFSLLDANGYRAGTFDTNGGANTAVGNSSCTAASPIVIATAAAHGFQVGDLVKIVSSTIAGLDGVYKVTATADATHFAVTFNNSAGGIIIGGKTVSMMATSTSSAVPGSVSTQDKAVVVGTYKRLGAWDQILFEFIGGAVNTVALTFDWVIQRPLDADLTKWEDFAYFTQANNTAINNVLVIPAQGVISNAVQAAAEYAYTDTSLSVNAGAVVPSLTATNVRPGHWGSAMRLVIIPRAASMDGTRFLTVQILLRALASSGGGW